MEWLGKHQIPFHIIFTKADKLKPGAIERNVANYEAIMLEQWEEMPQYFVTSSTKKLGGEELLSYIDSINSSLNTSNPF